MTDDKLIEGSSGYKINWDEVDENTNPFVFGSAKVSCRPGENNLPTELPHINISDSSNESPKKIINEDCLEVLEKQVTNTGHSKNDSEVYRNVPKKNSSGGMV